MLSYNSLARRRSYRTAIALTALASAFVATAALAPLQAADQPSGVLAGLISGILLAALLAYGLRAAGDNLWFQPDSGIARALIVLSVLFAIKVAVLPLFPGFGPDIGSYQAWSARIASLGPARTYAPGFFIDYPPGYLYALWGAGELVNLTGASGTPARILVEIPALIADILLAIAIFVWLRRRDYRVGAWVGMFLVALNPAMLFDTVVWGQSDSLLTLVMMLSTIAAADGEFELAWGLAALATLIKPQALSFLPVLALWTVFNCNWRAWWRAGLAFVAVGIIAVAPFQINHNWGWIFSLYAKTAAYYHETSVNAFNFLALIGGLRNPDSTPLVGIPIFYAGMALMVPLYGFIAWTIRKQRDSRALFYAVFLTVFGFFMFAPRMHERYLYPALAFAAPIAVAETEMLIVFAVLTMTLLFNLAYVKHALETVVFLKPRDWLAMLAAGVNLAAFGLAVRNWRQPAESSAAALSENDFHGVLAEFRSSAAPAPAAAEETEPPLRWAAMDTVVMGVLLVAAGIARFWMLGRPPEIVFDEVHFVAQARHYLLAEPFLDPHPPLAKLVIAAGIWLFGDHPWSWRVGNAVVGTALVGITYLLGRRMFRSRLAAGFAALCIAADGMFLVDSRIAVIDIVYVTMAAIAYLLLFRFVDVATEPRRGRLVLLGLGVALGLCLGSKLYIPAVTWLLVVGCLIYVELRGAFGSPGSRKIDPMRIRQAIGAVLLVGAISIAFYLVVFLPHYILGWWGGIGDLFKYYNDVVWYENSVESATHPYSSPWWSWPLLLRPVAYWQAFPKTGPVATVWGAGNPVLWWGGLTAIAVTLTRAIERPRLVLLFLISGYVAYLAIWIPIGRTIFLYHYMPAIYLAYMALGLLLADCWKGRAQMWEQLALMLTLAPPLILGLGAAGGAIGFLVLAVVYAAMLDRPLWAGRLVCAVFVLAALVAFAYFYPVWVGIPISREGYYARMWFQGPGLRNWI